MPLGERPNLESESLGRTTIQISAHLDAPNGRFGIQWLLIHWAAWYVRLRSA